MTYTSLNSIVKDVLMQKNYPLHWYMQCLVYAKNCLLELVLDDLKVVNTKRLPVDEFGQAQLPNDYVDYIDVSIMVGQTMKPLVENKKINSLANYNSSFEQTTYSETPEGLDQQIYYGAVFPFQQMVSWNEYGEPLGRFFGYGAGVQDDTFKIVRERNVIQLTENLYTTEIVLEYISSGMDADSATKVDIYAKATIESFIKWQLKTNSRSYGLGEDQIEERRYIDNRKILRARLSDLTPELLKRIIQKASLASPR